MQQNQEYDKFNKRGRPNKLRGRSEKNPKINKRWGRLLGAREYDGYVFTAQ